MGSFLSRTQKVEDDYNLSSTLVSSRKGQETKQPQSIPGRLTELTSSSSRGTKTAKIKTYTPTSFRANQDKVSFLDLPPELRNNIYCRLFVFEHIWYSSYIRSNTEVRGIQLLRTCKQIHEEAASVFYAANAFYLQTSRHLGWVDLLNLKNISADYPKGLTWPAARYHIHLTRIVIDLQATVPLTPEDALAYRALEEKLTGLEETLRARFYALYERLLSLWDEKDRAWSAKLICDRNHRSREINYMIAFSEDDEDVTKILLRKYRANS
ncbi:hypothetical protein K432DRAFT_404911 [Lepidopterella palustris CBS 459.81]|uniref:F-box domain-containing protein n=1 Tax=Lepidopterella palustris CBS 459.81 TaxID=1314670 RepID=A0A8E2EAA4_9PEZI|nr:hypothetical protein K432DRAFT_404911 [Lepidopterella palustris CBS 459.81]